MSRALLSAFDDTGLEGLWVTDGTAAGTHEMTGITGASTSGSGFEPFGFTNFRGEVLFDGTNSAGKQGLWVTDGTAAGTHEITGIAGANTSSGLDPEGFIVFN